MRAPAVVPSCLALLALVCCTSGEAQQTKEAPLQASATPAPGARVELPDGVWRGVCLAHNYQWAGLKGYGSASSAETLDHLKGLGVDWVSITPFGFMPKLSSPGVRGEHTGVKVPGMETASRVREVVRQAHARGIRVMLKPHIWIGGGKWRGKIKPLDDDGQLAWTAWWSSYRAFIGYYARMAQSLEVDAFVVGVELASAQRASPQEFLRTVKEVRRDYKGHISYSANWDETLPDALWSSLDSIGVQFYAPLSKEAKPSVEAMRAGLRKHIKGWCELAKRLGRKLMITETGFKSAPRAVAEPFVWPEALPESQRRPDPVLQRDAYVALFAELARLDEVGGVFVWKYFTDAETDEEGDFGFSPRGKPAEGVLSRAYGGRAAPP